MVFSKPLIQVEKIVNYISLGVLLLLVSVCFFCGFYRLFGITEINSGRSSIITCFVICVKEPRKNILNFAEIRFLYENFSNTLAAIFCELFG